MDTTTEKHYQRLIQDRKICAAKDCASIGVYRMEILFLAKEGWFCEKCKDSLIRDGLLIQQSAATKDSRLSSQGENNTRNDY